MNLIALGDNARNTFRRCEDVSEEIKDACASAPEIAAFRSLGMSEEGRPIEAVVLGHGENVISLIAGAHSDEPVGPETLRHFIREIIRRRTQYKNILERYKFVIVPHINPDGEARNWPWMRNWPSLESYVEFVFREKPGRDLEFGFPAMRIENRLVSDLIAEHAPLRLHMSLHGMAYSEGAFLLIERHWLDRTQQLRDKYAAYAANLGMGLHDHDRNGEKGFIYVGPGFTTTPEGGAMRKYFNGLGDPQTAAHFHDSSMEYVRSLGGEPLCLVTELPLFDVKKTYPKPAVARPEAYLALMEELPAAQLRVGRGESLENFIAEYKIALMPLDEAIRFQLYTLQLGLEVITESDGQDTGLDL